MNNVCTPLFPKNDKLTGHTTAAVVGKTFADISGNIQSGPAIETTSLPSTFDGGNLKVATCVTGHKPIGVFAYDRAEGEPVTLESIIGSVVPVTAGEAITAGEEVQVGAGGKAVPLTTGKAAGKAMTTAAANADCFIRLY